MPQLDQFTYFSQFFWLCLFLFTFYILRLLSGNVRNRELTIIQRRILRRLRNKKRSIKRKIENLNSYIQSQTTRKLPLFHADLLTILISIIISIICIWFGIPVIAFCAEGDEADPSLNETEHPSNVPSGASTSAILGSNSGESSDVDQTSSKSALNLREEELIIQNIKEHKGDVGDGQRISDVRKTIEIDFDVKNKSAEFELIKQMEKETGATAKKADCPVTNSTFNTIREHQSHLQDDGKKII